MLLLSVSEQASPSLPESVTSLYRSDGGTWNGEWGALKAIVTIQGASSLATELIQVMASSTLTVVA